MATMVRLTEEQIVRLLEEADSMETALKDLHQELVDLGTPKETMTRFSRVHDRFTEILAFLRRQRELGT
ncbi:hypothetical protein [uncultured Devosia sp.]|uniref:hypothetical protein n=1 Tax=uncultured Devosia sp. TaxID=211434 RepID=UPI0026028884|nr:hypothetical protein [uncultured Devosia sp.]